ncbi:MAG TPA: hypothetical protein VKR30_01490 [Candidatus Limnocylindrales bacterium]|nr:hypothetical protein [Candidatus Limnocylindrales bacterium]
MRARPSARPTAPLLVAIVGAMIVSAGCVAQGGATFPPAGTTPAPAGGATAGAQAQVQSVLAVEGIQLQDAKSPYRPPEGAIFASTARTVVQAVLPQDPDHGYIVLYAFGTPQEALAGAQDEASYIASGPGKVQFVPGTQFTLRVLGNIAIFFPWSPDSPDPSMASVSLALSQVGDEVPIPG